MPSAITIREAVYDDIPAISQVHVDTWRSTYAGIVPDEVLASAASRIKVRVGNNVVGRHVG